MSAVIKSRQRKNLPVSSTALWLVLGLAAIFFLVSYGQELLLTHDLNDRAAAKRAENAVIRDENSRLKSTLEYYQSDKYVEQRAREDLNLRRPEEEVLIPIEAGAASATPNPAQDNQAAANHQPAQPAATLKPPNWQKWFDLFVP